MSITQQAVRSGGSVAAVDPFLPLRYWALRDCSEAVAGSTSKCFRREEENATKW